MRWSSATLLDAGPCRRRHRGQRTPVFAIKGETLEGYWEYVYRTALWGDGGTSNMILDDGGDLTMLIIWAPRPRPAKTAFLDKPRQRGKRTIFFALIKRILKENPGFFTKTRAPSRACPKRRRPACTGSMISRGRPPAFPGDQRQRQRHQVEVRQPLWLPRVARRRAAPWHGRHDGRPRSRVVGGLRRRGQGLGRLAATGRLPRARDRRSTRFAPCRRRWKVMRS